MPRTRLAWHLFAGWCVLVAAVLVGCYWLASVQLAALATESQRQRLGDLAKGLAAAATGPEGSLDPAAFAFQARRLEAAAGIEAELLGPDGLPLAGDGGAEGGAVDSPAEAEARRGRFATGGRYDAATGRRYLAVAVPHGGPGQPGAIVHLLADTTVADAALTGSLRRLAAGCAACGVAALAGGWLLARRAARPMEELHLAAGRLAAGDVDARLPSTELAEVAGLGKAFELLREQLVERGLTIGRQGTQQEAVLGSMIEGVLAIDARQRIVGMNRAAAELLGIDLDNVIRRPIQEVIRNPDLRRFALLAIDCREPVEDDLVLRGGRDRTIRLRGTALRDVSGEGGAVIVLNDVTDVQRLENVRRDFVANVSHELKTPVASIKGFVETLLDGAVDDPANSRRFLEIVGRQADRLASIIEDLLALSRIEQSEGAGNLPLEATRIADVFWAVEADCGPRAAERSISLAVGCPDGLVAEANPPLLEQAVINLVDNAIKYSDRGGTVRLTAARDNGELVMRVVDDGVGIEPEHLPRLFERFYRVDKARSRKLGGTGLGLSIVKHIVQAHGGSIDVTSTPGVGSTFTIRLPAEG
jgi:two-component system, OmpR family, phosphate regulon sensor histidine kinase PhoR